MESDDRPSGRALSRREALAALGGAAILTGVPLRLRAQALLPACIATPAQMEGPFFTDARLTRSDIRSDPADKSVKEGLPLALTLRVSSVTAKGCVPLAGITAACLRLGRSGQSVADHTIALRTSA